MRASHTHFKFGFAPIRWRDFRNRGQGYVSDSDRRGRRRCVLLSACAQSALVQKADLTQTEDGSASTQIRKAAPPRSVAYGIASHYYYPGHTANGERYDPRQLGGLDRQPAARRDQYASQYRAPCWRRAAKEGREGNPATLSSVRWVRIS